jgi:hypothetical protein
MELNNCLNSPTCTSMTEHLGGSGSPAEGLSTVAEVFVIGPEYAIVVGSCRGSMCPAPPRSKLTALCADGLLVMPVRRWRFDSPHVAGFIQSQAENPELFIFPGLDTVHHTRHNAASNRKPVQSNRSPYLKGATETRRTSLGIHQKGHPCFRKGIDRIQAGDGERNLATDSGAAPRFRQKSLLRRIISPAVAALISRPQ